MRSRCSILFLLPSALLLASACSSGDHGATGATGGTGGQAGSAGGGPGAAGSSGSRATLAETCATVCSSQSNSSCPSETCQADCVSSEAKTPSAMRSCRTEYDAMAECEATLGNGDWACSSDENKPIPGEGKCTSTVCAWACCATDLNVPSDIWARCAGTCPSAGMEGVAGNGGTGGSGQATTGGSTGTGGVSSGGSGGSAGSVGNGGVSGGGSAGSGEPPPPTPVGGIPTGYPAPTADNAAKCKTVGMTNGLCPGGGAGPVCLQCLFGSATYNTSETPPAPAEATSMAGDYVVTAQLGAVAPVYVGAESSRGLLAAGAAGQTYAFVVNVRPMEGQPNHAGGPVGYGGLDLFFSGPTGLKVDGIGYALAGANTKPVMIYIAGDSTVCDQTDNRYGGWGQMLPPHFNAPVGVANYSNSGAASGSFGSYWSMIKAKWKAGDWVIIQFGHNDGSNSDAVVQTNLEKLVSDAQAANVTAIVISPPARAQFANSTSMTINGQASLHAAAAKAAAASKKVDYIDLTALTTAWYNSIGGKAEAMKYHALGTDVTHTNLAGAAKIATIVAQAIKDQNIALAKYLRQ